jgi:predicted deacylase
MIRALLSDSPESRRALATFSLHTLPIANPDGVARGLTRFNVRGWDLNRKWDQPAPADLAPENHALEAWLRRMAERGLAPHLGLDLHNDASGKLHVSRPDVPSLDVYLASMRRLEELLRQHTWFTEGSTGGSFRNPGTLGEGWLERFGVPAAILELNAHWIAGRSKAPVGADWEDFGRGLLPVFTDYFSPGRNP